MVLQAALLLSNYRLRAIQCMGLCTSTILGHGLSMYNHACIVSFNHKVSISFRLTAGLPVNGASEFRILRENPIFANLGCLGNESSIFDCPPAPAPPRGEGDGMPLSLFCSPFSAAGVICQSEPCIHTKGREPEWANPK